VIPLSDLALVAVMALASAAVVALLGSLLLVRLRGRSLAVQLGTVAVITIASVLVGVLVVTDAMYLSGHDARVAAVVVVASGVAGLAIALVLGRRVSHGARALAGAAQTLSSGTFRPPDDLLPAELAVVATEMKLADDRLREARDHAAALEASRRELVAWVSHDLRSPLAGLRVMAEALEDGVVTDPADVARYHRGILRETDRMATMVDDLFELSRIQAGALRLAVERVGLADLVSDAIAAADPVARSNGVRLTGSAPAGQRVDVDPRQMARVLHNLVANAIRHTPDDGTVEVAGTITDADLRVVVADTCGGIPEADLPRVFDVAFRGEPARTPVEGHGAGLGLAIARGIVEAHHGEIDVSNAAGGCRFEVRIPLLAGPPNRG
jgi:signal transduction histidine kinase